MKKNDAAKLLEQLNSAVLLNGKLNDQQESAKQERKEQTNALFEELEKIKASVAEESPGQGELIQNLIALKRVAELSTKKNTRIKLFESSSIKVNSWLLEHMGAGPSEISGFFEISINSKGLEMTFNRKNAPLEDNKPLMLECLERFIGSSCLMDELKKNAAEMVKSKCIEKRESNEELAKKLSGQS